METLAQLQVDERDGVPVAHLSGEIDLENAPRLQAALVGVVHNGAPGLVIDLTAVSYLDSAGIRLLFILVDRLTGRGQLMHAVVPADARVARLLALVSFGRFAPCHPTIEAAVAALREPAAHRAHGL